MAAVPHRVAFLLRPGRERGRCWGGFPLLTQAEGAALQCSAEMAAGNPLFPRPSVRVTRGDAEGQSCWLCRCVFCWLKGVVQEGAGDGRRGPFCSSPAGSRCRCLGVPATGRRARALGEQRVLVLPARVLVSRQVCLHVALERLGTLERAEVVTCQGDGGPAAPAARRQLQSPDAFEARARTQQEVSPELPARNCHVAIVSLAVAMWCC